MVEWAYAIPDCILIGIIAGMIYGLFGSGGGIVMTPGYYYVMRHFSLIHEQRMQYAIATTVMGCAIMAVISAKVHVKAKNYDKAVIHKVLFGLTIGTFAGVALLNVLPSHYLKHLFAYIVIIVALWLFVYRPEKDTKRWSLESAWHNLYTLIMGFIWFLLGVAVFTVPYLLKNGIPVRKAVGCAAIISAIFSILGGILFMITGIFQVGVSYIHIGFLNLPLLIATLISSLFVSHYTSKFSFSVPEAGLKYGYALLVLASGIVMLL